jgi:hypothetical protein
MMISHFYYQKEKKITGWVICWRRTSKDKSTSALTVARIIKDRALPTTLSIAEKI